MGFKIKKRSANIASLDALNKREWDVVMSISRNGINRIADVVQIIWESDFGFADYEKTALVEKLLTAPVRDASKDY